MVIGGIQKNSLIDYPGKLSCVLFLSGCNFTCPYCHNPQLVKNGLGRAGCIDETAVYEFLKSRKGFIDGVVISGGEPTLQKNLPFLCNEIREMGYLVKLDSNGSRPKAIKFLIDEGLVDYVAMDIKSDPLLYPQAITTDYNPSEILSSIETIMGSRTPYEFRTTCIKTIVDKTIIENIAKTVKGAELYVLQQFHRADKILNPQFLKKAGAIYDKDELRQLKTIAGKWVRKCVVR